MIAAFENFLDDISGCFIERNVQVWRDRLRLPFSVITKTGPVVLATDQAVRDNFDLYLVACDAMQLDLIDRRVISLEDCEDGTWLGTYETRLICDNHLATAPYTSTSLLHFDHGRFVMSSMLNGRGHQEWTGVSNR